jgi:dienelactone hydrolase
MSRLMKTCLAVVCSYGMVLHAGRAGGQTTSPASPMGLAFTIVPAADGVQVVRVSLPFPPNMVRDGQGVVVRGPDSEVSASLRPLTWHPAKPNDPRFVRCGMVTFQHWLSRRQPIKLMLRAGEETQEELPDLPVSIELAGQEVHVSFTDGPAFRAALQAPALSSGEPPTVETVESNRHFLWRRYHFADPQWPRVIEVRADVAGTVTLVGHLRRDLPGDGRAPDFGWLVTTEAAPELLRAGLEEWRPDGPMRYEFKGGMRCTLELERDWQIYQPSAHLRRRGSVEVKAGAAGGTACRLWRCRAEEKVPMQQSAWHRADVVIARKDAAQLWPTLRYPHEARVDAAVWDQLLHCGRPAVLPRASSLNELVDYHRQALLASVAVGDDWGNITGYDERSPSGGVYGMNRLNHCPAIFLDGRRSGDDDLIERAVAWCDNFYDQSIWWGPKETGGTRYNNIIAAGGKAFEDDQSYMWRSNTSVNFCTKGYDSFLLAYEETGDPRMMEALDAQVKYAAANIFVDKGECRNIGDVADFVRLYEYTGQRRYLDEALRLFRELRSRLSPGDLFSQGGAPIEPDPPFIDDDEHGYKHPFAKPYIIGYALNGLPRLARYAPDEPKLRDVVRAVADFLASNQDPPGGWRYPHPASSGMLLNQAMEHAWQIVQAADLLGPEDRYVDAVERVLRQRFHGWLRTGRLLSGLGGWEMATGRITRPEEIYGLYRKPADRDPSRDYTDGSISSGSCPPEGLVYFSEVLTWYLRYRPVSRLVEAPKPDEPLGRVLARLALQQKYQTRGVSDQLPVFRDSLADRLTYPLSWLSGRFGDFDRWKDEARRQVMACLLPAPPMASFNAVIVDEQDRGSYVARKVVFNISADSRVMGFLLVPKGDGPFPAVLLLHDHGAKFDIGKEKVIETWDDPSERPESARKWIEQCYGGRFIGDELAKRGYVCFCTDALNWSDRGGAGYEGQQALASNLLNLGTSLAGCIAHEDLSAAEFLAGRPEVDRRRVAAMGLSMGAFRTWQVAALSDHIAAGVAVCWMATQKGLMTAGNNQTKGQSAYTMTHPGLANYLDYPDVASIACPKPMLFYAGRRDGLFPVPSVEEAFATMHRIWESRGAGAHLETKLWDEPHVFTRQMQDGAFAWLDRQFGVKW